MIRILIRQVIDYRHRTPKSLAVADIEPTLELEALGPGGGVEGQTTRLYVALGGRDQAVACATFNPSVRAEENIWQFALEAIAAGLRAKKGAGKGCGKGGGGG